MQEHPSFLEHLLTDPAFWVAVGTLIFVALVFKQAKQFVLGMLDARSLQIQKELDRARQLREEAETMLRDYRAQYEEAVASSAQIVQRAQADAEATAARMEEELKAGMEKRRQLAEAKIAQAEAKAMQDVRQHIVNVAIDAAREIIATRMQSTASDEAVRLATAELQRKLH